MDNQERNREALIEHIAEQDRIIRRRNEQIENQARNAGEAQRAIDEQAARNYSLAADLAAAVVRAEKAAIERDEALARVELLGNLHLECHDQRDRAWASLDEANATVASLRAENPRTLTADDITDEMVFRAQHKIQLRATRIPAETIRLALVSALTEPTRPEGAEDIEAMVEESLSGDALSDAQVRALADFLAKRGVRVTGSN